MRKKQSLKIAKNSLPENLVDDSISIIDLLEPEEGGPVLKRRPPSPLSYDFHPEEMKTEDDMIKEALGLTDIPKSGPYGSVISRPRETYEEQDFEVANRTGFGGPSVIDIQEDKPPVNIKRKTINNNKKVKYPIDGYFKWLYTGKLERNLGDKMSFRKVELLKLARSLHNSGYKTESLEIFKIAQDVQEMTQQQFAAAGGESSADVSDSDPISRLDGGLAQKLLSFQSYWKKIDEAKKEKAKENPNEAFAYAVQSYLNQDEQLAVAAIYYGTDPKAPTFKRLGGTLLADALGEYSKTLILENDPLYWAPGTSWSVIVKDDFAGSDLSAALFASTKESHIYFNPETKTILVPPSSKGKSAPSSQGIIPPATRTKDNSIVIDQTEKSSKQSGSQEAGQAARVETGRYFYPTETTSTGPIHSIQEELGVAVDGKFGPQTYGAYKDMVGENELPKDPMEALAKVKAKKESGKIDILVDDEVLMGFMLAKPGDVEGLDLNVRKPQIAVDRAEDATNYISGLSDNIKKMVSDNFEDSVTGSQDEVETNLRNLYAEKLSGLKKEKTTSKNAQPSSFYHTSNSDLWIEKETGTPYRISGKQLIEATEVTREEIRGIMKIIPQEDKKKIRKLLIKLREKKAFYILDDNKSIYKKAVFSNNLSTYEDSEARKNRLKRMGK